MAGNANSGRRAPAVDRELQLRVIKKAWTLLEAQLDDPLISADVKRDIALKICPKTIPTELTGDIGVKVTAMGTVEKVVDGAVIALKYNIGVPIETEPTQDT
jgi:hypothetical protein